MDRCKYCGGEGIHMTGCPTLAEAEKTTPDFHDIALLDGALSSDEPALIKAAGDFLKAEMDYSDAEVEAAVANQRQRRVVHAAMMEDIRRRIENNPTPTEGELAMGAFMEQIEPQVRDAVLTMRRKGYNTVSSGFHTADWQAITFDRLGEDSLDETVIAKLEDLNFRIAGRSIFFAVSEVDMGAMKATWDKLAEILPDLGRPTPDTSHGQAKDFRQKYGKRTTPE